MDLILYNARLIGAGDECPEPALLAVKDGRIAAIDASHKLADYQRPGTKMIDCEGLTLLPGFHDAHCHIFSMAQREIGVDLGPQNIASLDELGAALRQSAARASGSGWISGHGYDDFYLGRHPNRHDLDAAVTDRPVVIAHRSLHACVLNSLALRLAGIDIASQEPPGAGIDREPETGQPSGLLYEMLGELRRTVIPQPDAGEIGAGLRRVNDYLLSRGVTSIQDAGIGNTPARYRALRGHVDVGDIDCRVNMMAGGPNLDAFLAEDLGYGHGDDRLRLGAAKFMLNVIRGELNPSEAELIDLVGRAHGAGFPVAIHAVEDTSIAAAINAISAANKSHSTPLRHRIEHAAECPPELVAALYAAGVTVVSQPSFLHHSGERYRASVAAAKLPYLYPYRSWLAAGIPVAGSSDAPVTPADPLSGVSAVVTRRDAGGVVLNPSERIPVIAALGIFTAAAAYAVEAEHQLGRLIPGYLADLVLLESDPRAVPPEAIRDIQVRLTIIGGRIVRAA